MLRIALSSTWQHRRRLFGTILAVVLGTGFLVGTLVLSDTMRASFRSVFTDVNAGLDVIVRGENLTAGGSGPAQRALVDASLVEEIGQVDGVAAVAPEVEALAQVVGADGEAIGGNGPPTLGVNWVDDPDLAAYALTEGRSPQAAGEVAIDVDTAETGELEVGDTTTVRTPAPTEVEIVGLLAAKGGGSAGVTITAFTLEQAQSLLLGSDDQVSRILVASDGASEQDLADRVAGILPERTEAVTGTAYTEELLDDLGRDFLDFFEAFLLVFAAIALLVATFSIYNTFSITVAQRLRESALMRALGASRRQVLVSVLVEALLTGLVAAVVGLGVGIVLAFGLLQLLGGFGLPVDNATIAIGTRAVVSAVAVGVGVTVLASLLPAWRASRVAPLAALRDVAVDSSDQSRIRLALGLVLVAVGGMFITFALLSEDGALVRAGIGAVGVALGVFLLGPVTARPLTSLVAGPVQRLRGVTGALARRNAVRNPRRTASTSSALMVGVGIVTLFTVVAGSIRATIDDAVEGSFGADLMIQAGGFSGAGLSPDLVDEVAALPEVERAVGLGLGRGLVDGEPSVFSVVDPAALVEVLDLELVEGSLELSDTGIAVSQSQQEEGIGLGDTVELALADGTVLDLEVEAVFVSQAADAVGTLLVPIETYRPYAVQFSYVSTMVDLADGIPLDAGQAAVETVTRVNGDPDVLDRDAFADRAVGDVDQLLAIVYGLLALAIVIALMGITNTLSLSVHERTREIGLLRALGQTRSQLRAMVRWESVIVALFGTATGLVLGTFLGWVFVRAIAIDQGFGVFGAPIGQLALVVALGALVGVVAALRPARRAARLDVLTAIATE
ncbi:MAG: FtsX-like permease family protein [Egicoccus sp.]